MFVVFLRKSTIAHMLSVSERNASVHMLSQWSSREAHADVNACVQSGKLLTRWGGDWELPMDRLTQWGHMDIAGGVRLPPSSG